MASRAWGDSDVEYLKTLADRRDWFGKAKPRFADRSPAALRCMMQKIRADAGMGDQRSVDYCWMADAINGTRRLLEAIERVGVRP